MAGQSEEKTLPASHRKLEKAREKGQVAASSDFVAVATTLAGAIYVGVNWRGYGDMVLGWLRFGVDAMTRPTGSGTQALGRFGADLLSRIAPLLVVVAFAGFVANVAHKRGLVFSIEPILPNFDRLNPAAGLARLFSAKSAADFGVALLRCAVWFAAAGLLVWSVLPALVNGPACGAPCLTETGYDLLGKLLLIALIIALVAGVLDVPLQVAFFLREMRMTRTELKRELKESMGSPEIRARRREVQREVAQGGGGLGAASLVVVSSAHAVALRYDPQAQPVPAVVAKGRDANADRIVDAARRLGLLVAPEPELAAQLFAMVPVGGLIPPSTFDAVAMLLVRTGALNR